MPNGRDHSQALVGACEYPAEVTGQMVANIAAGGAAVAVLSRQAGVQLVVVDAGSRAVTVPLRHLPAGS